MGVAGVGANRVGVGVGGIGVVLGENIIEIDPPPPDPLPLVSSSFTDTGRSLQNNRKCLKGLFTAK